MKTYFLAKTLSYIAHPLFLCFYVLCFWLWLDPYSFGFSSIRDAVLLLFNTLVITVLLPGLALLMMQKLQLISSLHLNNHTDRVVPLIVSAVFYFWYYINCRSNPEIPVTYKYLVFVVALLLVLIFMISIFYKISMHTSAWGLLISYSLIILWFGEHYLGRTNLYLFIFTLTVLIVGGLVGTVRLSLRAHNQLEVAYGYLLGAFTAIFGYIIYY